jgi:beta-xylosidase
VGELPRQPDLRTGHRRERWWSLGHATIVDTPQGDWWMMLHGYENGYYTLGPPDAACSHYMDAGRWPRVRDSIDIAQPMRKPAGEALPHGMHLSDDFSASSLGMQWRFFGDVPAQRFTVGNEYSRCAATALHRPTARRCAASRSIMPTKWKSMSD